MDVRTKIESLGFKLWTYRRYQTNIRVYEISYREEYIARIDKYPDGKVGYVKIFDIDLPTGMFDKYIQALEIIRDKK